MKMENQFWCLEYDVEANKKDYNYNYKTFKNEVELYYDPTKKLWVKRHDYTYGWYPASFPCRSYRAAKRHLMNHDEIPKGTKFRLVSRFIGFDRLLIKK